jgi:uncharacterized protein (TIGR04255 family)
MRTVELKGQVDGARTTVNVRKMSMSERRQFKWDLTKSFPHLPSAPIVEAVIQWRARAGNTLSSDELRKRLAERLLEYPECHPQQELQFAAQSGPEGWSTDVRHEGWRGFRFVSSDKLYVAQFTRDGLVFSRLAPYENWERFSAEGRRLWEIYVDLAAPSEVERLGVRFINRIMPVGLGDVSRFLSRPPKCLEPLGLPMNGFLYQSTHDVPGNPFRINVGQTLQPPAPPQNEGFGLILDIDVFTTRPFRIRADRLEQYLEKMRWLKNRAFFSLLTKRAIKSFQRVKK